MCYLFAYNLLIESYGEHMRFVEVVCFGKLGLQFGKKHAQYGINGRMIVFSIEFLGRHKGCVGERYDQLRRYRLKRKKESISYHRRYLNRKSMVSFHSRITRFNFNHIRISSNCHNNPTCSGLLTSLYSTTKTKTQK